MLTIAACRVLFFLNATTNYDTLDNFLTKIRLKFNIILSIEY